MATDISQQLKEWKEKYYQSITDLENQKTYDDLLQRSLGRLALAAQGLDPALDRQLKSLRSVLRGKSDQTEIENILGHMGKAITKMESSKTTESQLSKGEILAELLRSLDLPKAYKKEAKSLSKQLKSANDQDTANLLPDLLSLLNESLNPSGSESAKKSKFSLFGFGKPKDNAPPLEDEASETLQAEDEIKDSGQQVHLVLMKLLEHLSLPTDLSKKATKIRHRIESGIDDDELHQVISDIADIVSALGTQAVAEKQEYQEFLKTLTTRLNELEQHISQTSEEGAKSFQQRKDIGKTVEDEVTGLRTHVENADDLEQLKSSVSGRLDLLAEHFDSYQKSDSEHYEKSQKQIQILNARLHDMEKESEELRDLAEKSRQLALTDALTGIWNRQALDEVLAKEYTRWQRYQKPLSLIIWDIDFFKRVNDEYGHAAGDKVLKTIARIFKQATRDADFISRFGGEEFVGLFPETRLEDALLLANKVRDKIATSKFHYENRPVPITASAGLASFRPNDTIESVFKRADAALYRAKESGRNKCISDG